LPRPPRPERALRTRLEADLAGLGAEALHARLAQRDPTAAAAIQVSDHKRIVRALEVIEATGRPISAVRAVDDEGANPYNAAQFVIERPRALLYEAIDRRVEEMLRAGWLAEVRRLDAMGYAPDLQSMQALGYGWLLRHIRGELDLGEATRLTKRDTRRFAKRQLTWFRHRPGFTWLSWSGEADLAGVVARLVAAGRALMADRQT
jgi:tRNA dimethylallyltransferase